MPSKFKDEIKIKNGRVAAFRLTILGYEDKDEDVFVLFTPALDLYAYGDDEKEAYKAMEETLMLYVDHVNEENTIEKDLHKLGWRHQKLLRKKFNPPSYDPMEIMSSKGVDKFQVSNQQHAFA